MSDGAIENELVGEIQFVGHTRRHRYGSDTAWFSDTDHLPVRRVARFVEKLRDLRRFTAA